MFRTAAVFCAILEALMQHRSPVRGADATPLTMYRAGAARIDITPEYPTRLAGFGFRRTESEGVTQRIHAAALAIDDGGDPLVLVTADLCGVPAALTQQLAKRLQPLGVRRERFTLAVTHSHTTPMVAGYLPTLFGQPIPPEHQQHIDRYTAELLDKLERVAKDALANRRPARLSWGVGSVGFAKNRRAAGGPTDRDLPLLAVRDSDGKLRAVWASYACHCVTLSNNKISGDWARLDRGESLAAKVDYPVEAWSFGHGLALVFLPGEVVVDYGLRLKKELDGRRVWINAYSNAVPCYIPSERVLKEGGYEGGWAMTYYDVPGPFKPGLEQPIVDAVKAVVGTEFQAQFDPAKTNGRPLSPQQSLAAIRMRSGMTAELMAAEPLVASPVAIAFGPDGRLWVAEMYDYPSGTDGKFQPGGRIRVLTASRGDGHYDQSTVFLDNIPFPTGVTVWRNGILVCAAPDILYAEDSRGTGKADLVKKLYSGFGTDNYQARVNSLEYGLDGWVYGSCGLFGGTITSFSGKTLALGNRDFRIKPDTGEIEPATGRTQQGRVRDDWDNWFGCDNTHLAWHYPLPDHYVRRNPHAAPPDPAVNLPAGDDPTRLFPAGDLQLFKLSGPPGRPTAVCGIGVYRDDLLGKDVTGDLFVCEPVNLLIHRMKLAPRGSTFAGKRAPGEEQSEFLASIDPWFRPVQVRTGPDGCLWVVDMHRYVIEHPRWIPPEDLAKLDVRAGAMLGRIFRVRPAEREPRQIVRLDKLNNAGLVAALDSPNGWQRDLATQMLQWRDAKDAAPALAKLAVDCPRAEGRLHALVALDGLHKLTPELVRTAMVDAHAGVRRTAVRLSELFLATDDLIGLKFAVSITDSDAQVRLQAACSLGESRDAWSGKGLAKLALSHSDDSYLNGAVLSSVRADNVASVLAAVTKAGQDHVPTRLLKPLLATAVAFGDRDGLARVLRTLAEAPPSRTTMTTLATVLDTLDRGAAAFATIADAGTRTSVARIVDQARSIAAKPQAALEDRLAAIALLGRDPADRDILASLLNAREPAALQSAAAIVLARIPGEATVAALVTGWPGYSPALQSQILEQLLGRSDTTKLLLAAIERNAVPAAQIDAARRQRLLSHKDAGVRDRAAKLFAAAVNPDRQKVIDAYQDILKLAADAGRGRAVFAKSCSVCHQLEKVGHNVGPDLAQLQNKSPAYLLIEVLDPNRNVDSRYVEYRATTKAGRVFNGVLAAESATSVTLRAQEGRDQVLLRDEIEELESTGRSLMPEGLEKDLSRQDLADLFAYLGQKHGLEK